MKDVNELLFRCSSVGHLMTNPVSKADREAGNLSEGAKTHCIDVMTSWFYGRREEIHSKYLTKGNTVEEDSITLRSLQSKRYLTKNEATIKNEFICGTPDLFIMDGTTDRVLEVEDIKSSYTIFTFMRSKHKPLSDLYYWQVLAYMWLTGAVRGRIVYCLVNAPTEVLDTEKRQLSYRMGHPGTEDAEFVEKCRQIERNLIYDMPLFRKQNPDYYLFTDLETWMYDIPSSERIHTFEVERNEADIELIAAKVKAARAYIKTKLEGL